MKRGIHVILAVAVIVGALLLAKQRQILGVVRVEHDRLSERYGSLTIADPSKFAVIRVSSDDPTDFLWRIYYPPNLRVSERTAFCTGGSSSSTSGKQSDPAFRLQRCHFDLRGDSVDVHLIRRSSSGRSGVGSKKMRSFIQQHWNELEIEALASDGQVTFTVDKAMPLLIIRVPQHLLSLAEEQIGKRQARLFREKPFFSFVVGNSAAVQEWDDKLLEADNE